MRAPRVQGGWEWWEARWAKAGRCQGGVSRAAVGTEDPQLAPGGRAWVQVGVGWGRAGGTLLGLGHATHTADSEEWRA